ncbi:uncharacterized protein LOC123886256 [Trifolium pratense]|uniref:uncharacterized protein LOC123886256 n=1 Tax=Trifolium pratense TaxID=57577 RepID=UPI001E695C55|nr:uncharacterized protein LOC123886256 [Trifolium pratense]
MEIEFADVIIFLYSFKKEELEFAPSLSNRPPLSVPLSPASRRSQFLSHPPAAALNPSLTALDLSHSPRRNAVHSPRCNAVTPFNLSLSVSESIIKKSDHQLRSKEEDIALIKKMILEKEEVKTVQQNIVYKIDLDQALSFGRGALIKYKNSFKDNAIQGLTRVRNWLGHSAENDKNEDKQEVIIQENLKLPQEEGTCQ